jgi:glycosyltransferase involved in cell wall biosynthesis
MLAKRLPAAQRKMMVIPPPAILYMIEEKGGESRKLGRERLGLGAQDFVVAYFGVIYRSKGLETLLKAFQKVAAQRKDVKLALIGGQTSVLDGDSYFKEICELSRQLKIEDKIVARDYQWESTDGSLFLRAADVCVLPFDDGVTLIRSSLAGAATHGLPIITTQGDNLESPFIDGKNVLLCRPKDPENLAAAMDSLISNPELRRRLADGALEMSREWFSWDKAIDRTVAALTGG